jgi:hypothetical protein
VERCCQETILEAFESAEAEIFQHVYRWFIQKITDSLREIPDKGNYGIEGIFLGKLPEG